MHDIQHVHYPEFFSWPRRLSRRITYGLSAQRARYFQASSEFVRQDLLQHFECISPEQIRVIPEGVRVEEFSTPIDASSLCSRYALPERFLLYPAQLWPHKNHITLVQALKQIEVGRGLQIPLVLTGGKYSASSRVLGYVADQSMNYVHYLGRVSFTDLVGLYQAAAFLVMPSLHESNSLPILEAAAAGAPDRSLGPPDHVVGREDRRLRPDGNRDRVGRARVDLELGAVLDHRDRGVERVVAELRHRHPDDLDLELVQHVHVAATSVSKSKFIRYVA